MDPILIKPNSSLLNLQYQFIIRREFYTRYSWIIRIGYYFLVWIIFLMSFTLFTNPDTFIALKILLLVLSVLAVVIIAIFSLIMLIRWIKRQYWKKKKIKYIVDNNLNYWLTFDDAQISFSTDIHSSNIKWEYYKYYKEYKDSIYISPHNIYETVAFCRSEIGQTHYDLLKKIVMKRLTALK